jgi:hypothetical protein
MVLAIAAGQGAGTPGRAAEQTIERYPMKELNVPRSGKMGDVVARKNRYGQYLSQAPSKGKFRTAARDRAEANWARIAHAWETLTDEQFNAWERYGAQNRSRRRMGRSSRLSGWNSFFKVNNERLALGLELLTEPPPLQTEDSDCVGPLAITLQGRRIALKLGVSGVPAGPIKVYGSPPQNLGRRRCWDWRVLGLLPAPVAGQFDITEMYVAKYGWPPGRTRVFIWTKPLAAGKGGRMKETKAVVPCWERPASGWRPRQGAKPA